jgi:hypothetical protein
VHSLARARIRYASRFTTPWARNGAPGVWTTLHRGTPLMTPVSQPKGPPRAASQSHLAYLQTRERATVLNFRPFGGPNFTCHDPAIMCGRRSEVAAHTVDIYDIENRLCDSGDELSRPLRRLEEQRREFSNSVAGEPRVFAVSRLKCRALRGVDDSP